MTKRNGKKLGLNRETIRGLSDRESATAAGGRWWGSWWGCGPESGDSMCASCGYTSAAIKCSAGCGPSKPCAGTAN